MEASFFRLLIQSLLRVDNKVDKWDKIHPYFSNLDTYPSSNFCLHKIKSPLKAHSIVSRHNNFTKRLLNTAFQKACLQGLVLGFYIRRVLESLRLRYFNLCKDKS